MGTVERIGVKTTRVRALNGEQLIFANTDLTGSRISNYKTLQQRRVLFTLGVTYDTPANTLAVFPA
jgi:small-conductance mechanosensitive channel